MKMIRKSALIGAFFGAVVMLGMAASREDVYFSWLRVDRIKSPTSTGTIYIDNSTTVASGKTLTLTGVSVTGGTQSSITLSDTTTLTNTMAGAGTAVITNVNIYASPIGATSPSTGAFTTLSASGAISANGGIIGAGQDATNLVIKGSSIGSVVPSTGAFTTLSASGDISANGNIVGDASTIVTNMASVWSTTYYVGTTEGITTNVDAYTGSITQRMGFVKGILTTVTQIFP